MKKAIKINLSGIIFHIDEDAYDILKNYLDTISMHFSKDPGGEEIINDIEARIAELLQERITRDEEVVTTKLISEVIEIMGDPEDIVDSGEEEDNFRKQRTGSGRPRRLYRDMDNAVISGVSSGLGAYFNIDPLIIRVLFIVFVFSGASLIVYPILWIVMPRAETSAQKLEMRGEPVNVSNIEKKVREEYNTAKENVKSAVNSESVKKAKKSANSAFSDIGKVLLVFVKIILIILGTAFVLSGIGIIIGLLSGTILGVHVLQFGSYGFSLSDLLAPFTDPVSVTLLIIALTFLFLIPIVAMIYGLIKLIFSIKSKNRGLMIGATTLWVVSLFMVLGILAFETMDYSDSGKSESSNVLKIPSDTLYVTINDHQKREFERDLVFDLDLETKWYLTDDLERIYGEVELDIEQSDDERCRLEILKRSKGKNWDEADKNASNLNYSFSTRDNRLVLDPYFYLESDDKWRFPRVNLTLEVPEGMYIFLEQDTRIILEDVYNVNHISDWKMPGNLWLMTDDGLEKVDD